MRTRSTLCNYGDLGLRSGRARIHALANKPTSAAQLTITIIPFARTNEAGRIMEKAGIRWASVSNTRINKRSTVEVYVGSDWRSPPYDASKGVVMRAALAQSTCIVHVADLTVTMGEVVRALRVATKAVLGPQKEEGKSAVFDLNTVDMDLYNRLAFDNSSLPNNMALGRIVRLTDMYSIKNPMIVQLMLR